MKATTYKKKPRKIYIYKKANVQGLRADINSTNEEYY
jgi:hypothetical protein